MSMNNKVSPEQNSQESQSPILREQGHEKKKEKEQGQEQEKIELSSQEQAELKNLNLEGVSDGQEKTPQDQDQTQEEKTPKFSLKRELKTGKRLFYKALKITVLLIVLLICVRICLDLCA